MLLDRIISWVFPSLTLQGTPWYALWESKERRISYSWREYSFIVVAAAYIAHYLFFDRVMKLEPLEFWFNFE